MLIEFTKENNRWYIDMPHYECKDDLMILPGSDTIMDKFAHGETYVTLDIYPDEVYGGVQMLLTRENGFGGSYVSDDGYFFYLNSYMKSKIFKMKETIKNITIFNGEE